MTTILLKPVEYPNEKVLEFENLTDLGLQELREQLKEFEQDLDNEIDKRIGDD